MTGTGREEGATPYLTLRILETASLVAALCGIVLFAWSLVDIIRIETSGTPTTDIPSTLWPGIFIFLGAMVLLQVVRQFLQRYRRDDGTPRGAAREAAAVTAAVLSQTSEASDAEAVPATDAPDA